MSFKELKLLLLLFFTVNSFLNAHAQDIAPFYETDDDNIVYEKYLEIDKGLKNLVNRGVKSVLPGLMKATEHLNLTSTCVKNLFKLISGIRSLKVSAFRFLDATGKLPDGMMLGNLNSPGDYEECVETIVTRKDGELDFRGQYCMVYVKPILPRRDEILRADVGMDKIMKGIKNSSEVFQTFAARFHLLYDNHLKLGVCIPSGCSYDDVVQMLDYATEDTFVRTKVAYCDVEEDDSISPPRIIAICLFSLIGALVITSSSMDYYSRKRKIKFESKPAQYFLCFSVVTNFPKLINTDIREESMSCLFGVRALSFFYIVLAHQYYFQTKVQAQGHLLRHEVEISQFFMQIIINGYLTTEVFFFVAGLLNAYIRMNIMESKKYNISTFKIFIHRLWRLYPPYIFGILTVFLLMDARGPMRTYAMKQYAEKCVTTWWKNLLFIQNFFPLEDTCMIHSWYIAADTQLFFFSLLTVPIFTKGWKTGIFFHMIIAFGGILGTALWAWHKDLFPGVIIYRADLEAIHRIENAYSTALPHIAPYFTGLILGYILNAWKEKKIPLVYRFIGWPIAITMFMSMLFITQRWNSGADFTILESALYFSFSKFVYVLAIGWMVLCCVSGYGGVINYILSLKIWVPISRISYMAYLISFPLQAFYFANLRMLVDSHRMITIWRYIGDLGVSCLLSLVMVVTIESPFIAMEKIIFGIKFVKEETNPADQVTAKDNSVLNGRALKNIEMENNLNNIIIVQEKEKL